MERAAAVRRGGNAASPYLLPAEPTAVEYA